MDDRLKELLRRWQELQLELAGLETNIINAYAATHQVGEKETEGKVEIVYSAGRGSFDYEELAKALEPDEKQIQRRSRVVVDWRLLCEDLGATPEQAALYYAHGKPEVKIKLKL